MTDTRLHFYRGTRGMGVVISLSYGNDRIIFDFGAPFTPLSNIYDGQVKPREINRVKDTLLLGRIPMIPGVFSKDDLQDIGLEPFENSSYRTAIFICHAHLDHMSEIDKVAPSIPVYIHEDGLKLLQALDLVNDERAHREYSAFQYHETILIGNISVTPYFSDHPCPGSSGFLIGTPDSLVYYTGDIRFHGLDADRAFGEIGSLKGKRIDLLITDATTSSVSESFLPLGSLTDLHKPSKELLKGCISEQDIYDEIAAALKDFDGLAVFNQYERDTRMMHHMYDLAASSGRKLVMEPAFAYILYKLEGIKTSVCLFDDGYPAYLDEMDPEIVSIPEIRKDPQNYLLQNSYDHILMLSDFDGIKGQYFHLFGEPLVSTEKRWQIMLNILEKLGFEFHSFSNLYSFSHAYPNQLSWLTDTIKAKAVVAVHSKQPENLAANGSHQYFPDEDKEYILKDGLLIEV